LIELKGQAHPFSSTAKTSIFRLNESVICAGEFSIAVISHAFLSIFFAHAVRQACVGRSCEPMNKNRIEGAARQGERAANCEALVIKALAASIRRLCSEGVRS
jgi:hypothetical protein